MKYALRTALPNKICSGTFVPEHFDFNGTPMQWPVTFLLTSSARVCPVALTMGEKDIVVPVCIYEMVHFPLIFGPHRSGVAFFAAKNRKRKICYRLLQSVVL